MQTMTCERLADYITFGKAQRKIGISRHHLQGLIRRGQLRAYRLSERVLLLRLDEVQAMIDAGTVQPQAAAQSA